jgi:hypothetical protein
MNEIALPARKPRMPTETDLVGRIRKAVCAQPGAFVTRNNVGRFGAVQFGLGEGSADLVGCVTIRVMGWAVARTFALEIKLPGRERANPERIAKQRAWLDALIKRGGYGEMVSSVDEALAAVKRARQL